MYIQHGTPSPVAADLDNADCSQCRATVRQRGVDLTYLPSWIGVGSQGSGQGIRPSGTPRFTRS